MSETVKRRRLNRPAGERTDLYPLALQYENKVWNGFCEVESEPAIFNVILREFGVTGVKVQEVISLDDEILALLNKPVYGLIFLFRWREDDSDKQEASCPEGLWFANQTANNACASVALLNIVNNIEGIDLGDNLQSFKDFTMPFTPALRGDAINNFEFIKRIHNSFARKMDMLNSDLHLKYEAGTRRNKSGKRGREEHEADAGFHFIAFVPALGKVWKFDGLERQPQALGECDHDGDWLDLVKPDIQARMLGYQEDQIEFSILSLTRDPQLELTDKLALNIKMLGAIEKALKAEKMGLNGSAVPVFESLPEGTLSGADESYEVTPLAFDQATVPAEKMEGYLRCSMNELSRHRMELSEAQSKLRTAIREEQQLKRLDDENAARRRYDYGPAIRTWLRFLARKRVIGELISKTTEIR
ncbi:ubiquitin carboxyl-terminal hydrolase [Aspergillus californicus]